jgi:hypothetical protein
VSMEPEPRASRMKGLAEAHLRGGALLATARKVPASGGAHPILGHPRRLAGEGYCLLLHQLLFKRVGGRGQHVGARI